MGMTAEEVVRASRLVDRLKEARRMQAQPLHAKDLSPMIFMERAGSNRDFLNALGITEEQARVELAIFWADKLSQRVQTLEDELREMGVTP